TARGRRSKWTRRSPGGSSRRGRRSRSGSRRRSRRRSRRPRRRRMPPASDVVSLERLSQLCEAHERVLRWQYPEGALPSEWEEELARWPADSVDSALERLGALKHFYRLDYARRNPKHGAPPEEAEEAARQLLRREPVRVELGDVVAHVTSRSYA